MKIGIFDKWIKSLGGGEKVATVMAETLSKKYDVDLISYVEAEKDGGQLGKGETRIMVG